MMLNGLDANLSGSQINIKLMRFMEPHRLPRDNQRDREQPLLKAISSNKE